VFECFLYRIKRKENEVSRQLTLLSKKLQRQLRLLEILFEGKKYRFGDLEVMLDCSSKTLRTDLAEINTYAKGIEILMERESGVSAAISSHITEDYIYRIIMEESLEFRYLEAILLKNYEDYFTLAEGLFVSESTLRRIAAKVRTLLKDYHLTIQGLIKLSGDDQLITELTIQFLSEKYHYFENAFPIHFCQWIEKLVQDFLSENKLEEQAAALDSKEQQMLHFLVASRLLQIEKGMLSNQKKAKQNFQFKKILEKKLHLPITDKLLNKELLDYIFDPTMIYPVLGSKESNLSFSSSSKIVENIDSFIRKLERKYQLINEDRAKTRQKIIYRLNCQEIPSYLLYDKNQSILKYVQPELEAMKVNLKNHLKQADMKVADSFIQSCVSEIILNWPALLKKIEKSRRIKALVVTNDNGNYAKYMIKKLEHHLGNRYHFAANTTPSLTKEMLHKEKFDCIISNITLATTFSIPIFGISVFPNAREIYNLFEFYQHFGLY
jgi:hypothetical protein